MADWVDVRNCALALPGLTEDPGGKLAWRVKGKLVVWQRPLRKADVAALGPAAPTGPILGVRTADLDEKESMLRDEPDVFFTTPHFNGYPAVLCQLERMPVQMLEIVVIDAYLSQAPRQLAARYRAGQPETHES